MTSRPASSASVRPSASIRSVASSRPSSSIGTSRKAPTTASASRPTSRATQRPPSRIAPRPPTRQSARLASLYQDLVERLTGFSADTDQDDFETAVDFVSNNLDPTIKPAGSIDLPTVQRHLRGHAQKARINSHDILATAFDHIQQTLRTLAKADSDLDDEIHLSRMPAHIQFLLSLGNPPDHVTLERAESYVDRVNNPDRPPPGLSWAEILSEEPFEGQHWEGVYGLPPGSLANEQSEDDARSEDSGLSLSFLDDDLNFIDSPARSSADLSGSDEGIFVLTPPPTEHGGDPYMQQWSKEIDDYRYRTEVESLQARQYWRPEWRMNIRALNQRFSFGNPSSLGPAWHSIRDPAGLTQYRCIKERDAVREVLMALQGRKNILISWHGTGNYALSFVPDTNAPSLLHLSPAALLSMLSSFAQVATAVEHLRRFTAAMYISASKSQDFGMSTGAGPSSLRSRRTTRTLEAFAEAIDARLRQFDAWCASEEERLSMAQGGIGPVVVCSLLNLRSRIEDEFSDSFGVLLKILRELVQQGTRSLEPILAVWTFPDLPKRMGPAAISTFILNSLLVEVQYASGNGHEIMVKFLLRVFSDSAMPSWSMIYRWLKEGMPIRDANSGVASSGTQYLQLDEEFFVEDNELVLLDPDFWKECFVLRDGLGDGATYACIPDFLVHVAPSILAAGKAVGLLRALGMPGSHEQDSRPWLHNWQSFEALLGIDGTDGNSSGSMKSPSLLLEFPKVVYDAVFPICQEAEQMLSILLMDECEVSIHLTAMEDLYLMRRGDIISTFLDVLFSRMDSPLPWTDFHFLNTAFADVATGMNWLDPSLVRFSYRTPREKITARSVRALDGLQIEYAVPFPLTYIWGPQLLQVHSSVFVFVLQIHRAKSTLERILVRNALTLTARAEVEMKMFYAMRGKFSWFINVLLNFICTNVLHTQLLSFHKAFKESKSLDELIRSHHDHLQRIESQCLLQSNTTALHQATISILDMTIHFSDAFLAFAGDNTHDISRHTIAPIKSHRSRRFKRLKKNVIGFSQTLPAAADSSESESDAETDYSSTTAPSFSVDASSFDEDEFVVRLDTMSSELDALVRFIRRGVESLAAGTGEAASAFELLAFALEDWDQ